MYYTRVSRHTAESNIMLFLIYKYVFVFFNSLGLRPAKLYKNFCVVLGAGATRLDAAV